MLKNRRNNRNIVGCCARASFGRRCLCINCCDVSSSYEAGSNRRRTEMNQQEIENMNEIILDSLSLHDPADKQLLPSKPNQTLNETEYFTSIKNNYVHGYIRMIDSNSIFYNSEGSHYLNFKFDREDGSRSFSDQLVDVPKFMSIVWKLKSPQIIIPIITGINFKNWKNRKLEEQFRRGIIKAANKTEMWFITHGINGGISGMVGDAFFEEKASRSEAVSHESIFYTNVNESHSKTLTLIGIVAASSLQNWSLFDGKSAVIPASGNKTDSHGFRFDINPDHTHFIIYDDSRRLDRPTDDDLETFDVFRDRIESLLTRSLSYYRRRATKRFDVETTETKEDDGTFKSAAGITDYKQIPMVCFAVRGDLKSIEAIEMKIRKETPVMILKGSGGVCDIIAFAWEEISENKDPEYEDNFIKPELNRRLYDEFKLQDDVIRSQYRDKIMFIVKNGSKGSQKFLTILDMKGQGFNFGDLDKYILTALLQSQTQLAEKQAKAQLERNLRLTVDWNCPELALSEIFQRDDYKSIEINNAMFELVLLKADREEFVELFLDEGFYIHRYLDRNSIIELFCHGENREFFVTVILQSMLGHFANELPDNFLPDGLNAVLKELTSIESTINILEIYMNKLGIYVTDAKQAERKALNFLIIFAVIFNRHKLAKVLWKRTEDPVAVALVCSLMYKNLMRFCQENYLRSQIEQNQKDFAQAAIGVLDISFRENDPRSYAMLSSKHPDWNDLNVLELAYNAKNLDFIAHPCCQKILTKRLFGSIQIRETENGFIEFPAWIKVVLSASFIFPMYFWIAFPIHQVHVKKKQTKNLSRTQLVEVPAELLATADLKSQGTRKKYNVNNNNLGGDQEEDDEEEETDMDQDTKVELNKRLLSEINKTRKKSQLFNKKELDLSQAAKNVTHHLYLDDKKSSDSTTKYATPPFYKKVYMLWSSPFTKFWANFISYICFLILFGLVTLWPCCGNLLLDSILWLWTATIVIEDTRIAYKNYLTGSQLPMTALVLEIATMISFLVMFFFTRILGSWDNLDIFGVDRIFLSKSVLCVFMLYFYYRTLFIFLPISHQLGPMLVRMKLMVKHDFMTYLRLFLISMTAGSMALNAILYPYHPLNLELLKKVVLFRGFLQLFVADKLDLERTTDDCLKTGLSHNITRPYTCVNLTDGIDFRYTEDRLKSYGVSYKCNYMSVLAWVILIQYFLLVKLFLPTLLTALFSATGTLVNEKSEQLWMFQRYEIVLDYEKRLVFPPPFSVLVYVFMVIKWIVKRIVLACCQCRAFLCACCFKHKRTISTTRLNSKDGVNRRADTVDARVNPSSTSSSTATVPSQSQQTLNSYSYWTYVAQRYVYQSEQATTEKSKSKQLETNMSRLREELAIQKKSLQRLNDRVITMEKKVVLNQSYLEQIKNLLSQKVGSKSGLLDRKKKNYIHILSRESPYISTNVFRFFVYEKLVPWEYPFDLYDPPFIVFAAEQFKVDRIFIDDEINPKLKEEIQPIYTAQSSFLPPPPPPVRLSATGAASESNSTTQINSAAVPGVSASVPPTPTLERRDSTTRRNRHDSEQTQQQSSSQNMATKTNSTQSLSTKPNVFVWNGCITIDNPNLSGKKITIDRRSWITRLEEQTSAMTPVHYSLDKIGYPRNPMGRTGVRGRGCLHRYGPNHEIMAVVTRWKKQKNKPVYVERRKLLEFIAVKDTTSGLMNIPGGPILGDESKYSVVCRTLMELVFEEQEVERGETFTEEDMLTFFASFATRIPISTLFDQLQGASKLADLLNELGFIATMIYSGYIDDPRNTDNSWVEAEIWNFHYDKDDEFEKKIKSPESKWREVSSNVRINSNEIIADALKEIAEIHNGFFS